jgi:hypothetical protein
MIAMIVLTALTIMNCLALAQSVSLINVADNASKIQAGATQVLPRPAIFGESEDERPLPSAVRLRLDWERMWFVETAIVALTLISFAGGAAGSNLGFDEFALRGAQVFLIVGGLGFAVLHALWNGSRSNGAALAPTVDLVTGAFLVLAVVGALLPRVSKLVFGSASVEFEARKGAETASDLAALAERWLSQIELLDQRIGRTDSPTRYLRDFLSQRNDEAAHAIAQKGDSIRISTWQYSEASGGLCLIQSNEIRDDATRDHVFAIGEGLIGRAYRDQEEINVADGPATPGWVDIAGSIQYHGTLLVPIVWRCDKLGMIAVDRKPKEKFASSALFVTRALATVTAHSIGSDATRRAIETAARRLAPPSATSTEGDQGAVTAPR